MEGEEAEGTFGSGRRWRETELSEWTAGVQVPTPCSALQQGAVVATYTNTTMLAPELCINPEVRVFQKGGSGHLSK